MKTDDGLTYLLDVFSGADGGVDFAMLKGFIDQLKQQAAEGDKAAEQILDIQTRYIRLVKMATRTDIPPRKDG